MSKADKQNLKKMVQGADDKKKVNPLDLSSDQDLSIALMNLIAIEDTVGSDNDFGAEIRDLRADLMARIIKPCDARWTMALDLLGRATRAMNDGFRVLSDGKTVDVYGLFDSAYEMYAMFWGLNMGLVSEQDIINGGCEFAVDSNGRKMIK